MKLRYYLRGLGTGILVAALILGRLIGESRPLTDAEIKAKALTLGMVDAESLSLSDVGGNGGSSQGSSDRAPETVNPEHEEIPKQDDRDSSDVLSPDDGIEPGAATDSAPSSSPEVTPEMTTTMSESTESVIIEIFSGEGSYTVSRRLEEAGLVADAKEFNQYLIDNGYSRSIRAGAYTIPVGASWEEIVDIIT